jgi:alcohol dehydrogenase, propanol-preferring
MKAVQVSSPGASFELVDREIPTPQANEVLIRVEACGMCHGDVVTREGSYPGITFPRVPGHEVIGIVDRLGSDVTGWQPGQRVGVSWYGGPCRRCDACLKMDYEHCLDPLATGISIDGGYAEYMTAPEPALARIPDELDALAAAPLMCAGRTTFTALQHSGARAGDLVAIYGLGGLGHLGLQFAKKLGCRTAALSRGKDKEALAGALGADVYIDTEAENAAHALTKLGGARVILATVPNSKAIAELFGGLGVEGQLIIVAWLYEPVLIAQPQLFQSRRSIMGWLAPSTRNSSQDTLSFSAGNDVRPMIEVFPLAQAELAYEKMLASKVHFRAVLQMGG